MVYCLGNLIWLLVFIITLGLYTLEKNWQKASNLLIIQKKFNFLVWIDNSKNWR